MMTPLAGLYEYLDRGVSPYHAAAYSAELLEKAGFCRLEEAELWRLEWGKSYYVCRGGTALCAFRLPEKADGLQSWRVTASHGDSPTFRVKATEMKGAGGTVRLEVEPYGGLIMYSWMDRPLTVAGRLLVRAGQGLRSRLVYIDRDLCCIPSLAIHMDRTVNEGHKFDPQIELQPLLGKERGVPLHDLLAGEGGVCPHTDIIAMDLTLCPRQKAVSVGSEGEFFMAPRIDDLECAYTTLRAFLDAQPCPGVAALWVMMDNEEVGSGTSQGALGNLLPLTLERVGEALGLSRQQQAAALAKGFALSCDNAHAVHPGNPGAADPEHAPVLGGGPVIKWAANQSYVTNGLSGALFEEICTRAGVPVQHFANRAGKPGGSTLGNLQNRTLGMPMVDIGLPQLAMHSCVETASTEDALWMVRAVKAFYDADIAPVGGGEYRIG